MIARHECELTSHRMAQAAQYSLKPVDVITATISLEDVRSYRSGMSRNMQAAAQEDFPRVETDLVLSRSASDIYLSKSLQVSKPMELKVLDPMEEIAMAQAVFLWQYLTRTNSPGYFLSLSGGLDSATVALFVYSMARLVVLSIQAGEKTTLEDLQRVTGNKSFVPETPEQVVSALLHTVSLMPPSPLYSSTQNADTPKVLPRHRQLC